MKVDNNALSVSTLCSTNYTITHFSPTHFQVTKVYCFKNKKLNTLYIINDEV